MSPAPQTLTAGDVPPLGIIEGFYGRCWSWDQRRQVVQALSPAGYGFYLYAPKGDALLRRRWQEAHAETEQQALKSFATFCRQHNWRFGVGLSPYEIYRNFDASAQQALQRKLDRLADIGLDDLAILFDDMSGAVPDLAQRQIAVLQWIQACNPAHRLIFCPSYYSDDPVLDRVFGQRPAGYLETLGATLDPAIEICWTGEEVCSRAFSKGHLERISQQLQRKPFLWDNYPVNDGQRMSQYLYLRGFTGRPASMAPNVSAHGINPALQPTLACIPALTLATSYQQGEAYTYRAATEAAATQLCGSELGLMITEDLLTLQDIGLDRLDDKADMLQQRYTPWAEAGHPAAQEILAWLRGDYRVGPELVQTQ